MAVDEGIQVPVPEANLSSLLCVLGEHAGEPLPLCRHKTEGSGKVLRFQGDIISCQAA